MSTVPGCNELSFELQNNLQKQLSQAIEKYLR